MIDCFLNLAWQKPALISVRLSFNLIIDRYLRQI